MKTYGRIELTNSSWIINYAQPHVCIKLKSVFEKIPKGATVPFKFDDTPENAQDLNWFMNRYPLAISEKDYLHLKARAFKHTQDVNEHEQILMPDYKPQLHTLKNGFISREYQAKGELLYSRTKRLLIGDDLGLGKTMIGILSCLRPENRPALVVVQSHLQKQWADEIERFTDLKVNIIKKGKAYPLREADVYITKYSFLQGWVDIYKERFFKSVVFDEIQELRRAESNKYHGAYALSQNVDAVLGLSATPIYNYGDEIFNVMGIIKPGCLGTREDFTREWTSNGKVVKEPEALGTYLRDNYLMLRRTRADVGRELPPINKIVATVDYDAKEVQNAEDLARILAVKATTGTFVERGQAGRELDIFIRHMTGVSKAKSVADYVRILLESGEPVLLAGWHRDVYEIWMRELADFKPAMYTGSESPTQKQATKDAFVNGDTNLMIISLRSGVGLDGLQHRCKMVVFGELDWSPKVHDQVIARADRDGQKEQVTAIYLVSDFGSDPLVIDILGLKSSQSQSIVDPMATVTQQYSDESRIKLLAQQFLNKKAS
jgi:SNF2 family DNA or RNA helicase